MKLKTFLRNDAVLRFLCLLASLYIRLAHATGRWETRGDETARRLWEEGKPFILAFWHGRGLMMPYIWRRGVPIDMLTSAHLDGQIISRTIGHLGIGTITGSTSKGGAAALRNILKALKSGTCVGFTPDGPRGPRMRASLGVIHAARMSGVPILPASLATEKRKVLRSWDAFTIVKLFSRGVFLWGEPIHVPADGDAETLEKARKELEMTMNELTRMADVEMSQAVIEPAPEETAGETPEETPEVEKPERPKDAPSRGGLLSLYRLALDAGAPLVRRHLIRRQARGKEHNSRMIERFGQSTIKRPQGRLIWIHAASVGESLSALPLIEKMTGQDRDLHVLITTGTVTSAKILESRLPERCFHQFAPVDLSDAVKRFLDHWRPDAALYVESEFWPNMIFATRQRGIPMILVNARISPRSFRRWRRFPGAIGRILSCFDLCLGQNEETGRRLIDLGAPRVASPGNLKYAAAPLIADQDDLKALHDQIGERPFWVAASLHPGEEETVASTHKRLARDFPSLLTIVVPRHAEKGNRMSDAFSARGITVRHRSLGEKLNGATGVYMADTMGEIGLFYHLAGGRHCPVFMGGSLIPHGGQNPLEAAQLSCPLIFGPHMFNFSRIGHDLVCAGAARQVDNTDSLAGNVQLFLSNPEEAKKAGAAGQEAARAKRAVLDKIWQEIVPFLPGNHQVSSRANEG